MVFDDIKDDVKKKKTRSLSQAVENEILIRCAIRYGGKAGSHSVQLKLKICASTQTHIHLFSYYASLGGREREISTGFWKCSYMNMMYNFARGFMAVFILTHSVNDIYEYWKEFIVYEYMGWNSGKCYIAFFCV